MMTKPRRQDEGFGPGKGPASPSSLSPIPIEWLDPDCWRLPSGKALAEFALQAGFLAPLMLGMPRARRPAPSAPPQDSTAFSALSKSVPVDEVDRRSAPENRRTARESTRAGKRV